MSLDDFIIPGTPTSFQLATSVESNDGATLSQQVASAASIDPGNSNSNRLETNKRGTPSHSTDLCSAIWTRKVPHLRTTPGVKLIQGV